MDSQRAPLVSVITLNYNQAQVTKEFLESFKSVSYPNYEILVCDMASREDINGVIDFSNYPQARLLKSDENLGFASENINRYNTPHARYTKRIRKKIFAINCIGVMFECQRTGE